MDSERKSGRAVVEKAFYVDAWRQRRGQSAHLSRGGNGYSAEAIAAFARQIDALIAMKAPHAVVVGYLKTVLRG